MTKTIPGDAVFTSLFAVVWLRRSHAQLPITGIIVTEMSTYCTLYVSITRNRNY